MRILIRLNILHSYHTPARGISITPIYAFSPYLLLIDPVIIQSHTPIPHPNQLLFFLASFRAVVCIESSVSTSPPNMGTAHGDEDVPTAPYSPDTPGRNHCTFLCRRRCGSDTGCSCLRLPGRGRSIRCMLFYTTFNQHRLYNLQLYMLYGCLFAERRWRRVLVGTYVSKRVAFLPFHSGSVEDSSAEVGGCFD